MKKILISLSVLFSLSVNAHQFWPDSYEVIKIDGASSTIMTHLRSKEDANFLFFVDGKQIGPKQLIFAGDAVDFPIMIASKKLNKPFIRVCTLQLNSKDTMQKQVCLRIKVI